jgi:RNA polymerase sigma-70 factor, ECF subfamily
MPDSRIDRFVQLFADSQHALRKYVRRLVGSNEAAEDIVQESYMRTYEQGDRVETPRAFLFSTARNLAADSRRHNRLARTDLLGDFDQLSVVSKGESPESGALAEERSRLLKAAIARLAPQCRAVFTLRVFHGCSYKEIAERLGLSSRTVENHLAHAVRETHDFMRRRYK